MHLQLCTILQIIGKLYLHNFKYMCRCSFKVKCLPIREYNSTIGYSRSRYWFWVSVCSCECITHWCIVHRRRGCYSKKSTRSRFCFSRRCYFNICTGSSYVACPSFYLCIWKIIIIMDSPWRANAILWFSNMKFLKQLGIINNTDVISSKCYVWRNKIIYLL